MLNLTISSVFQAKELSTTKYQDLFIQRRGHTSTDNWVKICSIIKVAVKGRSKSPGFLETKLKLWDLGFNVNGASTFSFIAHL